MVIWKPIILSYLFLFMFEIFSKKSTKIEIKVKTIMVASNIEMNDKPTQ